MSNSIQFVGRLGKDPELRVVGPDQSRVLSFSVASDNGWGEKKMTNWFRCSIWGKRAESLAQYLVKGSQVFVIGELTLREWEKDGKKWMSPDVAITSIDFVGSKKEDQSSEQNEPAPSSAPESDEAPF